MRQDDGAARFRAAAQALNEAGDKGLRREVNAAFRKAAKPLGASVVSEGAAEMPRRGGFGAKVAAAKVGQSNSTNGRNIGVALKFRTAPGVDGKSMNLKAVDDGFIRHPLFGNRKVWRVTNVRPGAFRRPFDAGRQPVAKELIAAMERVRDQIIDQSRSRS